MSTLYDRLLRASSEPSSRLYYEWFVFAVCAAIFCSFALYNQWFWRINYVFYDGALQTFSRPAPDDMVLLAIDDESISRIGHWPWPREIHTRAVERLTKADANAVMFDILFNEPRRSDPVADEVLAEAIRANGRVVLPVVHESTRRGPRERDPFPALADAAAVVGHVHAEVDLDGIIRSTYLFEGLGKPDHPHVSLAMLRLINDDRYAAIDLGEPASADLIRREEQWQRENWFHIPFFGPPGHYKTYSYARWITGEIPDEAVKGKAVFIGITATGLGDAHPTPVSGFSRPMPGVEIAMHVFEGLRSNIDIHTSSITVNWFITAFLLSLLFFSFLRLRPGASVIISILMILFGVLSQRLFLHYLHWIVTPAPFIICTITAYPLWSWRRLATALRFLEQENGLLRNEAEGMLFTPAEGEHRVLREPVSRSIEAFRETREQLETARQERESFLNFLSHDMRSPQTSILALLDMRRRGVSRLNDEEIFGKITQYAVKTSSLADEFVQLAKAAQLTPEALGEVELTSLLDETLDALWPEAASRQITLIRNYSQEVAYARGHATLLGRAIANLLHNAIKFTADGKSVTTSIIDEGDHWRVSVRDEGPGLSEEGRRKLLGLPNETQSTQETGLIMGLALIRTVLERHNSALVIESTLGKGSMFYFLLAKTPGHGAA